MELDLKWVYMAQYELILKLDGAIWLRIISGHPQKPRARFMEGEESAHEPQAQMAELAGKCRRSPYRLSRKRCEHATHDMIKSNKQKGQRGQGKST